jgi:DNA-binding NarL/FixJ family response regulator
MAEKIRILLADDHAVLRQGMAQVLESEPDMTVIAQAENGLEAVTLARKHEPNIVLLDINMPELDGVMAAKRITADLPETRIIILTMYRRDDYVFEAIKVGASGYLLKEAELDELLAAIRTVAEGGAVIDPAIAMRVLAELRQPKKPKKPAKPILNEHDIEILKLLVEGMSNKEIADRLSISEKTVRNRLSLIFRKLHLENRTQAALYALKEGLVEPEENEKE